MKSLRLGFKRISNDAYDFLKEYFSREDTTRYLPLGRAYREQEVREFIESSKNHWQQNGFGLYLIYRQSFDDCIGYCGLEYVSGTFYVDLRYGVVVKHWGKGYATEAAKKCLQFGFDQLRLPVIYGAAKKENMPSIAIMKKIGMRETDEVNFYGRDIQYFKISALQ